MKKKNLLKRSMAFLLTAVMAGSLLSAIPSGMTNVQAADGTTTAKTIAGLGTGIIAEPTVPTADTDEWAGSYVYYGTYGGNPVKYRVLDKDSTDFGGTTMLLDCDTVLWTGSNPSSAFDSDSNVWADSDIKSYLNSTFLTTSFSSLEQNAIAGSTKTSAGSTDGNGWSSLAWTNLNGEKIFLLDAKEATNTSYGYYDTYYVTTGRIKTGGNARWWLRSPYAYDSRYAGYVYEVGNIIYDLYVYYNNVGVSPALNVNLSSVLFSSVISGNAGETGAEYKLTLLDSDMTIAGNGDVTRSGDTVTIPYTISGTNKDNATQVSILILDRAYSDATKNEAVVKYYGALDTSAGNGTGTFTLPAELSDKVCGKDYYAYIIAEDVNGEKETDYASSPVKIQIPWIAREMNLGVNGIINPIVPTSKSDAWTGCYVYYGTYSGNPVKYRVLDKDSTDFGGTTMLLDCDTVLWTGSDPSSKFDDSSNVWADSDIKSYLNSTFLTTSFSTTEQNAIAGSTKTSEGSTDGNGWSSLAWTDLNGEKIFFLDAKEATNTSYGYYDTDYNATGRIKTGGNACWWLRSPSTRYSNLAGYVYEDGLVSDHYVYYDIGVSPALNLNLSSVIFSSASGTSKSSVPTSNSNEIGSTTGTEWKLTLSDSGKSVKVTDNEKVIKSADGTITVPYTYTDTATTEADKVNQISVMITDKAYTESDANILYYGALQNIKDTDGNISTVSTTTTGTGTFELPRALDGKVIGTDYHVYVLAEHTTDTNATDYASTPVELTSIYDEIADISIEITAPKSTVALDTDASVTAAGVSASTVSTIWTEAGSQVSGNADYNTVYTVSVTVVADNSHVFTNATTATINGNTATVVRNSAETITVTYTFPATEKGTIDYTVSGYEGTYDGKSHCITVNVTNPTDTKVTYSTDGTTYSATNPQFTDKGTYTVYYKLEREDYTTVTGSKEVTIKAVQSTDEGNTGGSAGAGDSNNPNTGDNTPIGWYVVLLAVSGIGLAVVCFLKKKKHIVE